MRTWTLAASACLALLVAGTPQAQVLDRCYSPEPGHVNVDMTAFGEISVADDDTLRLKTEVGEDLCDATNTSTRTITVRVIPDGANYETFVINHGGPGGPLTQVFDVDLGGGGDSLAVDGTQGSDRVIASSRRVSGSTETQTRLDMEMYRAETDRGETSEATTSTASILQIRLSGGPDMFGSSVASPLALRTAVGGEKGRDHLTGGTGDDFLYGGQSTDQVDGGPGDDHLDGGPVAHGGQGDDELTGGGGEDVLWGGGGNDRLLGGPGRDRLDGGPGQDMCRGGAGKDAEEGCE